MVNKLIGMDPVQDQPNRWDITIDGEEIRNLQSKMPAEVTEDERESIRDTAAAILSHCPRPTATTGRFTGLALGKVQSGKTLSYTALIALAVDNGYRITVVLTGTKKLLLELNYGRLCNDLEVASRARVTPFKNPRPGQDIDVIESVLHGGSHALIVILKNRRHIEDVRRILRTPTLSRYPILVIDDEGDEASLNTQFRSGRRSPTYNSIVQLRRSLQAHAYVAYTATPQANLLISGVDDLSPDFGVLIQPGQGYCGGSIFFGEARDRYIRVVPEQEADFNPVACIPEGLVRAIAIFIVGGAIRHLKEPLVRHSMLIHNSSLRTEHNILQTAINNLANLWRDTLALPDLDPAAADLLAIFRAAYDDLSTTVPNIPPWDQVRQQLQDDIRLEVWMVNSLPFGRDPIGTPFRLKNNILIGGNMLGRGVTIPGLAVTYITRRAKQNTNADTMEQRARWFGYKEPYLDICRIFLTPQLRDDYTELLRYEDDLWDALSRNERQGLAIRDWPRLLALDMNLGLRPTRQNVANYKQFRGNGWDIQNRVILDRDTVQQNIKAIKEFFDRHPGQVQSYGSTDHTLVQNCPTDIVIKELLSKMLTDGTDWEKEYTIEYLVRLMLNGHLPSLDILLMAKGTTRDRNRARDIHGEEIINQIENLMQGPNPSYLGDRNIHNNRIQLQVHIVQLRGSDIVTSALALYIPSDDPQYDLRYVVRD